MTAGISTWPSAGTATVKAASGATATGTAPFQVATPNVGTALRQVPWNDPTVTQFCKLSARPLPLQHTFLMSSFTTYQASVLNGYPAACRAALVDMEPATPAQLDTFLATCAAAGLKMWITLAHNPTSKFATAADYFTWLAPLVPIVRKHGYPHVVDFTDYEVYKKDAHVSWTPVPPNTPDDLTDMLGQEFYADGYYGYSSRLDKLAAYADSIGKPFCVDEIGADQQTTTVAQGTEFFTYALDWLQARVAAGKTPPLVCAWNGGKGANPAYTGYAAATEPAAWLDLYGQMYDTVAALA